MEVLRHKNTIKVFEMIEIKDRYEYIMEFVEGEELMEYV